MSNREKHLKDRFLRAVVLGELGSVKASGIEVKLKDFKRYFSDINTQYVNSFMPAATFAPGYFTPTHTKFLFRVVKGVYLVHCDVLVAYMRKMYEAGDLGERQVDKFTPGHPDDSDSSVNEAMANYRVTV